MGYKTTLFVLGAVACFGMIAGCGDDDETGATASAAATTTSGSGGAGGEGGGTGGSGGASDPPPPALGAQIERMGRPAINTALNHTFDGDTTTKDAAKDAWNLASDPTQWGTSFAGEVAANLAILDSLDTVCGNQPLAGPNADATRYATLAGALADDRLWVNTKGTTCSIYLAVEADAALGVTNDDCGGRTLAYDVIDQSYSILAAGDLTGSVGDSVDADADTMGTTFPYLAAPY